MKYTLLIAGAAALAFAAAPAAAKPGHGHGKHANHARHVHGALYGYSGGGCPPGLRMKGNDCMPPGQVKRLYRSGQRFPSRYGNLWSYNQIPYDLRQQYSLNQRDRYYYGDGYLYQVDPRTMLIQRVVSALLR